jgi:hypothetical protein
MNNRLIYIVLLLTLFIIRVNSKGIDTQTFTVLTLDNPAPGYLLMDPIEQGKINLTDNSGVPIYVKNIDQPSGLMNFKLQPNGKLTYFSGTQFYEVDENYNVIDSFSCVGYYTTDFHELLLTPEGNAFLIGREIKIINMDSIVSGGQKTAMVIGNVIQELDKNKNLIFQWSTFDHYKLTDVTTDDDLKMPTFESAHINAICIDSDGNILISARALDEITKINPKTGDIMWRLGGKACKNNQFQIIGDTIDGFYGFSHQHSLKILSNGNILLYDNGNMRTKPFSRAVEYSIDESNKTIKLVWQYRPFPDTYAFAEGSVQRLDNGNTLIGWGMSDRQLTMTEVFPDGSKAMEITNYQSYSVYRFPVKMAANENFIKTPGRYEFSDSLNQTGVSIDVYSSYGAGYVSVERHYYAPYNLSFVSSSSLSVFPNRWVLNNKGISKVDGIIRFDISKIPNIDPLRTIIAVRPNEGIGQFYPLETQYNSQYNTLEANIQGFGEFILCFPSQIETPILIYPPNDSTTSGTVVSLGWQVVNTDSKYRCQIAKDYYFNDIVLDSENISDSWLICNLENSIKYYWRVKAISDTLESDWSNVWSFTTIQKQSLDAPVLISPFIGTINIPISGNLQWSPVDGATFYNVELSTSPDFQPVILKRNKISSQALSYNNLDSDTKYFWHIAAGNDLVISSWSTIWNFTTEKITSVVEGNIQNGLEVFTNNSGSVQFKFTIDKPCTVSLTIVDITGRVVSSVLQNNLNIGQNNIFINSRSLTTGLYFYRINVDTLLFHGKFIIQ